MANTTNNFIKSKMNQDLDSRLVPNGEYRSALNISISQAEGSDVGTVKTVLGNIEISDFGLTSDCNIEIIGYFVDDQNNDLYLFMTNFVDTSSSKLDNYPSDDAICQIWRINIETSATTKLVEGKFLNFSINHPIIGVNLLEELLFWTDNRNQPRKINVKKANPGNTTSPTYYTNEDQISVAKYYPHDTISLVKNYIVSWEITADGSGGSGSLYSDYIGDVLPTSGGSGTGLTVKIVAASATPSVLEQIEIVNQGVGYQDGDVIQIAPRVGTAEITVVVEEQSTMKDVCSEFLPFRASYTCNNTPGLDTIQNNVVIGSFGFDPTDSNINIQNGNLEDNLTGSSVKLYSGGSDVTPYKAYADLVAITFPPPVNPFIRISWPNDTPTSVPNVDKIVFGANPDYNPDWPGDCEYLKDKFVRFAYRFKFDDNEYSLISPFTQACFIPKQNGYFFKKDIAVTNSTTTETETINDTEKAFEDTDVEFFENRVTNVDLVIPCPSFLDENITGFNNLNSQMHVEAIEIIYKDDAENILKVADTIPLSSFENLNSNNLVYSYQSRKPSRVLPESEITRVSDTVPLKAATQEIAGNRVMYGNYIDGHTSLQSLNYELATAAKFPLTGGPTDSNLKKEYQNHTLKQNRSYQVGLVLSDRYGRQSDVILSSLDLEASTILSDEYKGSTIFHNYKSDGFSEQELITASSTTWNGDNLFVKFNEQIPDNNGLSGYPGLFRGYENSSIESLYGGAGYPGPGATNVSVSGGSGSGLTVDYVTLKPTTTSNIISVTINAPGTGYTAGDLITIPGGSPSNLATFVYNPAAFPNLTGWYSYKIVVKQTEQDYYNVYLPGIVNGSLNKDGVASAIEASVSLFSDNINKVPKDLTDVSPTQTAFNSSEVLSLRVSNDYDTEWTSSQFYPGTDIERVNQISELTDLGISLDRFTKDVKAGGTPTDSFTYNGDFSDKIQPGMSISVRDNGGVVTTNFSDGVYVTASYIAPSNDPTVEISQSININNTDVVSFGPPGVIYNSNNNPLIGILSTSKQIGVAEEDNFAAQLAVAETKPFQSLLDIYYETSTSGLIKTLNNAIQEGIDITLPFKISNISFELDESQTGSQICTNSFTLLDATGGTLTDPNAIADIVSVFDGNGAPRDSEFSISNPGTGSFEISTDKQVGEGFFVGQDLNLTEFAFTVKVESLGQTLYSYFNGEISNVRPSYQDSYDGTTFNLDKLGDSSQGRTFYQPFPIAGFPSTNNMLLAYNGSGDVNLREEDLEWVLVSAFAISGQNYTPTNDFNQQDLSNGILFWPDDAGPFPEAWVENPSPNTVYENWQIVKQTSGVSIDYRQGFDWVDPTHTTPTYNKGIPIHNIGASTSTQRFKYYKHKARLNFRGLNSSTNGATLSGNSGIGAPVPVAGTAQNYNSSNPFTTATIIRNVTFRLTVELRDRSGSGLTPAAGSLTFDVVVS